ncbi:MAG: caspase family protein [Hyphomicrobiales bacterium]
MLSFNRRFPVFAALVLFAVSLLGAAAPAEAAKRAALVIGNGAYVNSPALANPANDAGDIAKRLRTLSFEVVTVIDGTHRQMLDALSSFGRVATGADVALFFYAGHGVQVAGRNWLLPVSSAIEAETDLPSQAVRANDIVDVMEASGAALKLVILDACRNNPLPRTASRGASRGLARVEARTAGTMITFATAPGDVAADGDARNSPFTAALLKHIATPGLEVRPLMGRVRETVYESTGKRQLPWVNEALIGEFYFAGEDPDAPEIPAAKDTAAGPSEKEAFALAQSIGTESAWDAFLERYPDGAYAAFAIAARDKLTGSRAEMTAQPSPPVETASRDPDFLFPRSDSRLIEPSELDGLSKAELRIARNEIFARRGRFFKSADLKRHFGRFGWYQPHAWEVELNRVERANVDLIHRAEQSR